MANIQYRLSTKSLYNRAELMVRFYSSRALDLRAKAGIFVPVTLWNAETQRCNVSKRYVTKETIEASKVNNTIDRLSEYIITKYQECRFTADKDFLKNTILQFHNIATIENDLMSTLCIEYAKHNNLGVGTARHYKVLSSVFLEYGDVHSSTFTIEELEAFAEFLAKGDRGQNTINGMLKKVRAVQRWALSKGFTGINPFEQYHINADVYGTPIFLTLEERDKIYNTAMPTAAMEEQRDIFIFQCHIGCRVSDLMGLTKESITSDGEFIQYIQKKLRRKLPSTIRVPLTDTAKQIVAKYASRDMQGKLLPFISPQRYNDNIKKVIKYCGIDRVVLVQDKYYQSQSVYIYDIGASHLARRTFMANMFKATKSERIVSAFTGHVDGSRAFARYTHVDDDMKKEIIKSIDK